MSYKALLFCPNEKTARVVKQILSELEFRVEPCNEPFAAVKKLMAEHFDAIVVDCENDQNATLLFKSAHNSGANQAALAVAVVEGQAGVAQAFRIGANLVLTKPINVEQSKGTLRVARGLLRKTEATKAAGPLPSTTPPTPPAPSMADAKWPSTPEIPAAKPRMTSLPAQPPAPSIPAATASVFELEEEPELKPEPTEAALLESMPDPQGGKKHATDSTTASVRSKEYPWQPVARSMAEPMASALRRAAEAAGKVDADSPAASNISVSSASIVDIAASHSYSGSSGSGHAAATAPAKDAPHSSEEIAEIDTSQAPAPLFSSIGGLEASDAGGSIKKKMLIAVVVLIAAAAGGYIGWTKMHPATTETPVARRPVAPAQALAPAQPPASSVVLPSASPEQGAAPAAAKSQPTSSQSSEETIEGPDITLSTTEKLPATSKITKPAAPTISKKSSTPDVEDAEPMVVKSETPKPAPKNSAPEQAEAPPDPGALGVASDANDQAISGIMSAPPANAPQPAPQAIRVSQGIAQGLLVKSVQPVYPQQARQLHMQGAVELSASISKDGNITSIKVLSGDTMLARAAVDAVKQWQYKPYLLNGQPVEIQTQITVNFKLP